MRNTWKLSNYLFSWFLRKYERYILGISVAISFILLFFVGDINGKNKYEHIAIEFRTYDLIVDYSNVGLVFLFGLLTLFASIFIQTNSFYSHGKGMYSIFTLPMKRYEVFGAFFISAAAAVMLYFAVWLIVMVVLYFPVTGMYEKAASQAVLHISEEVTLRDLDVSITNGMYLGFLRSTFLSTCFPSSWVQALALWGGMFLSIVAVVFAGLYNEYIFVRVILFFIVMGGFLGALYQGWLSFQKYALYSTKAVMPQSLYISAASVLVGVALLLTAVYKLKRRKDI